MRKRSYGDRYPYGGFEISWGYAQYIKNPEYRYSHWGECQKKLRREMFLPSEQELKELLR